MLKLKYKNCIVETMNILEERLPEILCKVGHLKCKKHKHNGVFDRDCLVKR